jgi:hypothetical protein
MRWRVLAFSVALLARTAGRLRLWLAPDRSARTTPGRLPVPSLTTWPTGRFAFLVRRAIGEVGVAT